MSKARDRIITHDDVEEIHGIMLMAAEYDLQGDKSAACAYVDDGVKILLRLRKRFEDTVLKEEGQ